MIYPAPAKKRCVPCWLRILTHTHTHTPRWPRCRQRAAQAMCPSAAARVPGCPPREERRHRPGARPEPRRRRPRRPPHAWAQRRLRRTAPPGARRRPHAAGPAQAPSRGASARAVAEVVHTSGGPTEAVVTTRFGEAYKWQDSGLDEEAWSEVEPSFVQGGAGTPSPSSATRALRHWNRGNLAQRDDDGHSFPPWSGLRRRWRLRFHRLFPRRPCGMSFACSCHLVWSTFKQLFFLSTRLLACLRVHSADVPSDETGPLRTPSKHIRRGGVDSFRFVSLFEIVRVVTLAVAPARPPQFALTTLDDRFACAVLALLVRI